MAITKENRDAVKAIRLKSNSIGNTITDYIRAGQTKTVVDLKHLIKLCKEYEAEISKLAEFGLKTDIHQAKFNYKHWEDKLNTIKSRTKIKKQPKPKKQDINSVNLYYIMLCWTIKPDFYVCDNIVSTIKSYFEKLQLEFIDTTTDNFPDRNEFVSTYKIKTTHDVYNTIINSAEFIIDMNTTSINEKCNVGVFGKKIE